MAVSLSVSQLLLFLFQERIIGAFFEKKKEYASSRDYKALARNNIGRVTAASDSQARVLSMPQSR